MPQSRINDILVEEAQRGLGVVRLKGGDPYVLGRGGEERLACEAHGIRVEVVPGVTSAVAVPAAAGIPVTHRGVARGFTVVTGHDGLPAVPPTGGDHTLVLLMGVTRLARIAALLALTAGRPASAPSRSSSVGSPPDQRIDLRHARRPSPSAPARRASRPRRSSSWATSSGSAPPSPADLPQTWVKIVAWTTIFTHVRGRTGRRQPTSERRTYCRMPPLR